VDLSSYDSLTRVGDSDMRHAWDVFGRHDRLGTVNLLTPERVRAGSAEVRLGLVTSLDLPLNEPDPPLFGRAAYRQELITVTEAVTDDRLDAFHPQGSTQWDALRHVRSVGDGYWGGRTEDASLPGELGIDQWAEHGVVGRAVLLDVAGGSRSGMELPLSHIFTTSASSPVS
jgi:hypothetical protein